MDPSALFNSIFHSNPEFAASFMALVHNYTPTAPPTAHPSRWSIPQPNHAMPNPTHPHNALTSFHPTTSTRNTTPPTPTPFQPTLTPERRATNRPPAPAQTDTQAPPTPTSPWILIGPGGRQIPQRPPPTTTPSRQDLTRPTTQHTPTTSTDPTPPNADLDSEESKFDEEEIPLSQSDYMPTTQRVTATPVHSTHLSAMIDQHDTLSTDHDTLSARHAEGRVWSREAITRKCIVIKIAIVASDSCDQSPTTSALEPVIDAIIDSLGLPFPIDRVAILSFDTAIPTRQGSIYFTYAYLSPRSSNPHVLPYETHTRCRRQLEILQGVLHSRLDGPNYFNTIPDLPPIANHLRVTIPLINDMDETFQFLIDGISVALLLGTNKGADNVLTQRYLGFLIFKAVRDIYPTLPPHNPFPSALNKFVTRQDIGRIISVKTIRFTKPITPNTNPQSPVRPLIKKEDTQPHPLLGVIITNSNPLRDILHDALFHVCTTHASRLHICGPPSRGLSIHLHLKPSSTPDTLELAKEISTRHNRLHDSSQHRIVRNIRIHQNALLKPEYLLKAAGSLADCVGFLPDFSQGVADLRLTALFASTRNTSFLRPDSVTSRIIEANATIINLTPGPPVNPQLPPPSLRSSAVTTLTPPRGRGRGSSRMTATQDRSGALFRVQTSNSLRLNATTPSHKFYVIINGIGGLATTNIYALNFDNDGVRMLITHVPFAHHKSFATYPEAWSYYTSFYTHIATPEDATFMNNNCPAECSNLNNPCPRFQEIQGLNFTPPACTVRAFVHYSDLTQDIRSLRDASSNRMTNMCCTPIDGYTFLDNHDPTTSRWMTTLRRQDTHQHDTTTATSGPNTHTNATSRQAGGSHTHPMEPDDSSMQEQSFHTTTDRQHDDGTSTEDYRQHDDSSMHEQSITASSRSRHHLPHQALRNNNATPAPEYDDTSSRASSTDLLLDDIADDDDGIEGLSQDSRRLQITHIAKKRSRHDSQLSTTTHETARREVFITFNVPMTTSERDIFDELQPAFEARSIPDEAYLPSLRFHGYPSIHNIVEKHATLTCTDASLADSMVDVIRGTIEASYAYRTESVPHAPTPADIDLTPLTRPPRYCQIRSCTFHNNRRDIYPNSEHGLDAAEAHGIFLHGDLYRTLTTSQLQSIGWARCCDLCPTIHMNPTSIDAHRERCITYTNSTAHTRCTTDTGPFQHLRSGIFAPLYRACPPQHVRDLDRLIIENPQQSPITLFAIVQGWHTASESTLDSDPTATTNLQNEQ